MFGNGMKRRFDTKDAGGTQESQVRCAFQVQDEARAAADFLKNLSPYGDKVIKVTPHP